MAVGGRVDQTSVPGVLRDHRERIRALEATPPGASGLSGVWGAVLNDGSVIEGTGFSAFNANAGSAPWSALTAYVVGDIVSLAGSTYICILANTNQSPPDPTYWTPASTANNIYLIVFAAPFTNPPVVLLTANNDNPPAADGRYTASLLIRAAGYIVVLTENVDDPDSLAGQDGGFDFIAIEPGV